MTDPLFLKGSHIEEMKIRKEVIQFKNDNPLKLKQLKKRKSVFARQDLPACIIGILF